MPQDINDPNLMLSKKQLDFPSHEWLCPDKRKKTQTKQAAKEGTTQQSPSLCHGGYCHTFLTKTKTALFALIFHAAMRHLGTKLSLLLCTVSSDPSLAETKDDEG